MLHTVCYIQYVQYTVCTLYSVYNVILKWSSLKQNYLIPDHRN